MKIFNDISSLVGNTPLLDVSDFLGESLNYSIYAKLEYLNPAGSIKDRAALYMIMDAEDKGLLKKGYTIIEPTSGNTGIGLAAISASRGYKVILTMPDTMSEERRKLLKAYGAEIILTSGDKGMSGAVAKANELLDEIENSIILGQFSNNANALAHYETTAPEIYADTRGDVDFIVAGIGTGGTLTGIARFFKEKKPDTKIIGVEPSDSPLLTKGVSGPHKLQGIGANFVPEILDTSLIDEVVTVSSDDAFLCTKSIAKNKGILVGISSGAALAAALKLAEKPENAGKKIVVILPDTGDRYLSTNVYE